MYRTVSIKVINFYHFLLSWGLALLCAVYRVKRTGNHNVMINKEKPRNAMRHRAVQWHESVTPKANIH